MGSTPSIGRVGSHAIRGDGTGMATRSGGDSPVCIGGRECFAAHFFARVHHCLEEDGVLYVFIIFLYRP